MDTAVAVVQAYLQINGYFTVCEYPVIESTRKATRSATDLDVLAFRFPGAGREVRPSRRRRVSGAALFEPDPALGCPADRADMIVGEVKEGRAHFNPAARDPLVLGAALARFGCCPPDHAPEVVRQLLASGHAVTAHGHAVRMVAFGGRGEPTEYPTYRVVPLGHAIAFLRSYLEDHWGTLHAAQLKLPGLDLLALLHKCESGS